MTALVSGGHRREAVNAEIETSAIMLWGDARYIEITSASVRPELVEGLHFSSKKEKGFDRLSPNGGGGRAS
ncbi:MAG TPA: hypothetical protein VF489_05535 [Sphingobium sp.]